MRVVKKAEERKQEILDAADELFRLKGFDGTSTNDILNKVNIARGTLYHHFKSKEDIMDALIEQYNLRLLEAAHTISRAKSIPVVERLIRAVMALKISDQNSEEIMAHIHKPQNALLHQKIQKAVICGVTPILTNIIEEGIEQDIFNTPFPYECMEMIVIYATTLFDDDIVILSNEERASRISAFITNVERLLGAKSGTLGDVMKVFANK